MSGMAAPKKKSVFAVLAAALLVAVGGWVGVDLSGSGDSGAGSSGSDSSEFAPGSSDGSSSDAVGASGLDVCPVDTLPSQADPVIDDILSGGPYDYPGEDGGHFGNYEGELPEERGSYYRSYTVDTPGLNHRGAKRIVVGGGTEEDPEVWYYSDDHYESFCEIPDAED